MLSVVVAVVVLVVAVSLISIAPAVVFSDMLVAVVVLHTTKTTNSANKTNEMTSNNVNSVILFSSVFFSPARFVVLMLHLLQHLQPSA